MLVQDKIRFKMRIDELETVMRPILLKKLTEAEQGLASENDKNFEWNKETLRRRKTASRRWQNVRHGLQEDTHVNPDDDLCDQDRFLSADDERYLEYLMAIIFSLIVFFFVIEYFI